MLPARAPGRRKATRAPAPARGTADGDIFDALRVHRAKLAREQDVPAYVIASDRSLNDMVMLRPRSAGDLRMVHGMGPTRIERYGEGLLAVLRESGG